MFNCVLSSAEGSECKFYVDAMCKRASIIAEDKVSPKCHYFTRRVEEPVRCDICGVIAGRVGGETSHVVGNAGQCTLCGYCHAAYDCITHGQYRSHNHARAMEILKDLIARAGVNL